MAGTSQRIVPSGLRGRRGFALRDVVAATAMAGLLLCLSAAGLSRTRNVGLLEECRDNQRRMLAGSDAFALANQGVFMGLSWQPGNTQSQYPDLQNAPNPNQAQTDQAIDLLRRNGREDIPKITGWYVHGLTTGLVLIDFLGLDLADEFNVCPADAVLLQWRRSPDGFDAGAFGAFQPPPSAINRRFPYTSSYAPSIAAVDRFQSQFSALARNNRTAQSSDHRRFTVPGAHQTGPSNLGIVRFPSGKVFFSDLADRHVAPEARYYALAGATPLTSFFDGSVRLVQRESSNTGWIPHFPTVASPATWEYRPDWWEPLGGLTPVPVYSPSEETALPTMGVADSHRFTRNGLLGWDYSVRADRAPR